MAYFTCVRCDEKIQYDSDNCQPPDNRLCEDCYFDRCDEERLDDEDTQRETY